MLPTQEGSFRLFRFAGINVFLHWSWLVVAMYEISSRRGHYTSFVWNVAEYLTLFLIVLLHEFGHSLACRQVGGEANQIVLWPLGGVAYVAPPQRPGATLWSIAAGPLVNVVLFVVLVGVGMLDRSMGWNIAYPDLHRFLRAAYITNFVILIFNLLPIYPLDGGQILRSLLWFVLGRARSLLVASVLGFVGVAGLIAYALYVQSIWTGIMAVFILMNCWQGLRHALFLAKIARLPRREGYACPECRSAPPLGAYWVCGQCRQPFDTFASQAMCPRCGVSYEQTGCLDCGARRPMSEWILPPSLRADQ
ncbi:MAG: site-2 protease family protein [Opitutae bacterium]|nr:site-2 protease family protein [Opitutae bacterium]